MASNEVLSSRLEALTTKVDELRDDIKEDITNLTGVIANLAFVDQRVHDIEIAAIKELVTLSTKTLHDRADNLERELSLVKREREQDDERRALNFRLAVGAVVTAVLFPLIVGLIMYEVTKR